MLLVEGNRLDRFRRCLIPPEFGVSKPVTLVDRPALERPRTDEPGVFCGAFRLFDARLPNRFTTDLVVGEDGYLGEPELGMGASDGEFWNWWKKRCAR